MNMRPTEERFREVFNTLEPYIERRYGIPVIINDVPDPFTGDLDGAQIHVDYETRPAERLFLICHLFGHTVQWNVNPRAREIGQPLAPPVDETLMPEIMAYEREAAGYALALLHAMEIRDLDQWLTDLTICDLRYLVHFYRTGEKKPMMSFFEAGQPLLAPIAIPEFRPTKWIFRADGIVV